MIIIICLIIILVIILIKLKCFSKEYFSTDKVRGINNINYVITIPEIKDDLNCLESLRIAGSIHKNIRKDMYSMLKPGLDIMDLSNFINKQTRYYTKDIGYNGGIGFPPILSMSNTIAHYSPYKKKILGWNDNLKIDFGVHVNGWIVDSAFTIHFNPELDILSIATKDAIDNALKIVGVDTPINDVSSIINEIVESYEITYKGSQHQLKVIDGLLGHNILQYNIHGGINVPNKPSSNTRRFEPGIYAIEPFVSILDSSCFEGTEHNNYRIKSEVGDKCPIYKHFNNLIFSCKSGVPQSKKYDNKLGDGIKLVIKLYSVLFPKISDI
jgi:methionyl aminopeptidase